MKLLSLFAFVMLAPLFIYKERKVELVSKTPVEVKEPSDILLVGKRIFVVSDNGYLHEMDATGKILKTSSYVGIDFEAVTADSSYLYVSEESNRKVTVFDFDLNFVKSYTIAYSGGRNQGFESIAYSSSAKKFYLFTEKNETLLRVYDTQFSSFTEVPIKGISDISSCQLINGEFWLLSDEDHTVFVLNDKYEITEKIELPVINPEGFSLDSAGNLLVVSDDMQMLYKFQIK